MSRRLVKLVVASTTLVVLFIDARPAMAQVVQSDTDAQPGTTQTTQLVTSSTEVRRAVYGLIVIAAATLLATLLYWYKTGQQARQRHARQYGGSRAVAQPNGATLRRRQRSQPSPVPQPESNGHHTDLTQPRPQPVLLEGSRIAPQRMDEYLPSPEAVPTGQSQLSGQWPEPVDARQRPG